MREKYIPVQAEKKSRMNRKTIIPVMLIVLLLCVFAAGTLVAKYVSERNSEGVARAKEFYFTSNLLDGGTHTISPGSESITFTLSNHADELRFSEMDISYKVTVDETAKIEENEGTLKKNAKSDATVTISGLQPGTTYTVTAVGEGGYKKTLTAKIEVPQKAGQPYYHIDTTSDYTLLTVWNEGNEVGKVTIKYTGIPDNTNPNMMEWATGDTAEQSQGVEIKPHESKVFRFFGETKITVQDATEKKDIS